MNNQNPQNPLLLVYNTNNNVMQQPGQFNLSQNSGGIMGSFTQMSQEKEYFGNQPPVIHQQHLQLPSQQLMINQQKMTNKNITTPLQGLQPNFNQIVNNQPQILEMNYQSSNLPIKQIQQATPVSLQNPFANPSLNNQASQMTLNSTQAPTIPQNLQKNQPYLQNKILNGTNNKQTINQNHIVQNTNTNTNNLQTQDGLQHEMTLPIQTTQNQIKGAALKKQQIAFQAPEQARQSNQQQQKNSQYQQLSLQNQQNLQQIQNFTQNQSSTHQNIHNPQPIIKPQPQNQIVQNNNEFEPYIGPKSSRNNIISNQINTNNTNSITNNYNDFNQQQQQKLIDQQKLSNLYPQQTQIQNQLPQERVEDKKIQLMKDNLQQIQQQNQLQLANILQNEGEGEAYGEAALSQKFINIQKTNKVLILSEKIKIKYENKDVNNSLCTDFDINNWTNEIDQTSDLYEMTLAGHLIKGIRMMNGEATLNFLIEITKPFLKNYLRRKSGKPFGEGEQDRIIKGGLAEHCFQKKDQNQDIWTLNLEKLQTIINETNEKLMKYIDNLKKSKGKGQTSVISQDNQINQNFQQQGHQNLNENFQGTSKPNKNGEKKQRRKNQDKLKDKTNHKQNTIFNNLGKDNLDNYGDNNMDDQNDLIMNEDYNVNDRNSDILLGDDEEKKENHAHQSYQSSQIQNYSKQNKTSLIKQEETNLINQGFYLSSNPPQIQQNQYLKNIDIKIEQDRKTSQQIGNKQNSFQIPENITKKRFQENDDNVKVRQQFDEGNHNNGPSSKTALYRQHQGTQPNLNQFNDTNDLQGFSQAANLSGNLNQFQNKGFVMNNKIEQLNEDSQQKIELSQKQIKCKKLAEQQIKDYKKKHKVDQFSINEQLNQELEKKENQDITKSINSIDQLKIVGMAICYGIFKDQITKTVNVIKENQDSEVRKMNQRSKEMKQMLQQLQLL